MLQAQKSPFQVRTQDSIPILLGQVGYGSQISFYTSVVHRIVEPVERSERGLHHCFDIAGLRNIGHEESGVRPQIFDLTLERSQFCFAPRSHHDICAPRCKSESCRPTDPAARAGYQRCFTLHSSVTVSPN
jgi:hypothetical protein